MKRSMSSMEKIRLWEAPSMMNWRKIAESVQKLNFDEKTEEEWKDNLKRLTIMLEDTEIDPEIGKIETTLPKEIGLANLLHAIYKINTKNIKEEFYNQIENLNKIGVEEIQFLNGSFHTITSCEGIGIHQNPTIYAKTYTDGFFTISNYYNYSHLYSMENLHGANYYIDMSLKVEASKEKIEKSVAILENFNGVYPSKEEIMDLRLPMLEEGENIVEWKKTDKEVRQHFKTFSKKL